MHTMSLLTTAALQILFEQTLSPEVSTRREAERFILQHERIPGHAMVILSFILDNRHRDSGIGQAAAIYFKHLVKKEWSRRIIFSHEDRVTIKGSLVELMCTLPPAIQSEIGECIAIIASSDFPTRWSSVLPALTSQLRDTNASNLDWDGINGVLLAADFIFRRWFDDRKLIYLRRDHLQLFLEALTKLFLDFVAKLQALALEKGVTISSCLRAIRSTCSIFHSVICEDLPNDFKSLVDVWVEGIANLLEYKNDSLLLDKDEDIATPGPVDNMHVALIQILNQLLNRNEKSLFPFLPKISYLVQNVLMSATPLAMHNELATTSIRFLSSLIGKMTHKRLFEKERTLEVIFRNIVIPNMMIREIDEQCFAENPEEFILSDLEDRAEESRRQCTRELLGVIHLQFEKKTTFICWQHVYSMLDKFANDTRQWKMKECSLHLIYNIVRHDGFRPKLANRMGVNVVDFFYRNILTELREDLVVYPMLKATCINFLGIFMNEFTNEQLESLMPLLIAHLESPHVVVHTYAAATIEKMLTSKVDGPNDTNLPDVIVDAKLGIRTLLPGLLSIVDNNNLNENEYVMKCLLRALDSARDDMLEVAQKVLEKLTTALALVTKNPKNPQYNYYLFECIAILIRSVCNKDAALASAFEPFLFPLFQNILQIEVVELTPYVFQMLAQLLEFRSESARLDRAYGSLLPPILTPSIWESKRNIPSLARLLEVYLNIGSAEIAQQNLLSGVLEVVKKLVESETAFTYAFDLLEAIVLNFPRKSFFFHTKDITHILMMNLQNGERPGYAGRATHFFALCIAIFGAQTYVDQLNQIEVGMGLLFLTEVWVPNLEAEPPKGNKAKTQIIGLTNLLCETPSLLVDGSGRQIWPQILTCALNILFFPDDLSSAVTKESNEDAEGIDDEGTSYMLHFATRPAKDPFANVLDAGDHLVRSLTHARVSQPDSFIPLFRLVLQSDRARLENLCQKAGMSLIL